MTRCRVAGRTESRSSPLRIRETTEGCTPAAAATSRMRTDFCLDAMGVRFAARLKRERERVEVGAVAMMAELDRPAGIVVGRTVHREQRTAALDREQAALLSCR